MPLRVAAYGEAQLPIVVPGVDVVVDEDHPDAQAFQLPGVFQSVHRVSGEAGYLFGEDQVEPSQLSLGDHAVERLSLAGAGAGNALALKSIYYFCKYMEKEDGYVST